MNNFNKYFSCVVTLILLVSTVSTSSIAGALLEDPLDKNLPIPKIRPEPMGTAVGGTGNVTPITRSYQVPQKISCWQNGELIFEQSVIAPKDKITDMRLLQSPKSGVEMLALDFKNAFCFIK